MQCEGQLNSVCVIVNDVNDIHTDFYTDYISKMRYKKNPVMYPKDGIEYICIYSNFADY